MLSSGGLSAAPTKIFSHSERRYSGPLQCPHGPPSSSNSRALSRSHPEGEAAMDFPNGELMDQATCLEHFVRILQFDGLAGSSREKDGLRRRAEGGWPHGRDRARTDVGMSPEGNGRGTMIGIGLGRRMVAGRMRWGWAWEPPEHVPRDSKWYQFQDMVIFERGEQREVGDAIIPWSYFRRTPMRIRPT
jgi:hypothetical protein